MTENVEWKTICTEWCKQNNAKLLFVNDGDFGCELENGKLMHIYYDELIEILKGEN